MCPIAGLQPLGDQRLPWPRATAVPDDVVAALGKSPVDIGVQDVVVVANGTVVEHPIALL